MSENPLSVFQPFRRHHLNTLLPITLHWFCSARLVLFYFCIIDLAIGRHSKFGFCLNWFYNERLVQTEKGWPLFEWAPSKHFKLVLQWVTNLNGNWAWKSQPPIAQLHSNHFDLVLQWKTTTNGLPCGTGLFSTKNKIYGFGFLRGGQNRYILRGFQVVDFVLCCSFGWFLLTAAMTFCGRFAWNRNWCRRLCFVAFDA